MVFVLILRNAENHGRYRNDYVSKWVKNEVSEVGVVKSRKRFACNTCKKSRKKCLFTVWEILVMKQNIKSTFTK